MEVEEMEEGTRCSDFADALGGGVSPRQSL